MALGHSLLLHTFAQATTTDYDHVETVGASQIINYAMFSYVLMYTDTYFVSVIDKS